MRQLQALSAAFLLAFVSWNCNDGGSPTSSSSNTQPPPVTTARWTLTFDDAVTAPGISRIFVTPTLRLQEHNGAGYHVNFIRLEIFTTQPGYRQRKEFGSTLIVITGGGATGNYVPPRTGGSTVTLSGTYELTLWPGDLTEIRLTVSVSDDAGNRKELVVNRVGDQVTALKAR